MYMIKTHIHKINSLHTECWKAIFDIFFYIFVKPMQMELKPLDNVIHFFSVMYPGHLDYKNIIKTYSHEINSLYTECWKPFLKTRIVPFVKQMQIAVKPL